MKRFIFIFNSNCGVNNVINFSKECKKFLIRSTKESGTPSWARVKNHYKMSDEEFTMYFLKYSHCISEIIFLNEFGDLTKSCIL